MLIAHREEREDWNGTMMEIEVEDVDQGVVLVEGRLISVASGRGLRW